MYLLGQYLYEELRKMADFEVVFVWNRTTDKMRSVVSEEVILEDLAQFSSRYMLMLTVKQK